MIFQKIEHPVYPFATLNAAAVDNDFCELQNSHLSWTNPELSIILSKLS